jgi:putative phage-type endonuclease
MPRYRMISPVARQIAPWNLEVTDHSRWLELRRQGVGASDLPGLLGLTARGSAWETYLDKTGALPPEDLDDRWAEMIWFGHEMEAVAAKRFRHRHPGTQTHRIGMVERADQPWMRASLDRRVTGCPGGPCLFECKNRSAWVAKEWDPDGDPDRAPDAPIVQTQWQLMVTGYGHGHLVAVIGGNELREYRIDADPKFQETLFEEGRWFWHDCVLAGVAPPIGASEREGKILARLWDVDPDAIKTADDAIEARSLALHAAKERAKAAVLAADQLEYELEQWLGPCEVALAGDGRRLFTWKQNSTFRDTAFREEQPEAFAKYSRTVQVTDTKMLADEDPELFRSYRARQFRLSPLPREDRP